MISGVSFGLLGRSLGVLGSLRELIEGPWRVLGELLGCHRGCLGCFLESVGVLGWLFWCHWGGMKTFKNNLFFSLEHLDVLETALGVLGGSCGGPWGPWRVSWRSLRGPWGSLGAVGGSLGVLGAPIRGNIGKTYVSETCPRTLGAPWELLQGSLGGVGEPLEVLGGPRGAPGVFWDPWGCLGGPYGNIGGL